MEIELSTLVRWFFDLWPMVLTVIVVLLVIVGALRGARRPQRRRVAIRQEPPAGARLVGPSGPPPEEQDWVPGGSITNPGDFSDLSDPDRTDTSPP